MMYPKELHTRRSKIVYWLFKQLYRFDQGWDLIGLVGRYLPVYTSMMVMIKYFGFYDLTAKDVVVVTVFATILCYFLGRLSMRYNIDKLRNLVWNERNPVARDVYAKIKGKEEF